MNFDRLTCPCGHSWVPTSADRPADLRRICPQCTVTPEPFTLLGDASGSAAGTVAQSPAEQARAAAASFHGSPRAVPGFEILEEINRGGMGVVYKARQLALGRVVALKTIPPRGLVVPGTRERFEKEILALGRLNHPNVVSIYLSDLTGPVPYLAMEYVPGIDLRRLVKTTGPLPVADAVYYMREAAEGLQYAHEQGLVHRDIKPSNIMVSPGPVGTPGETKLPRVKVLDMGVARVVAADGTDSDGMTEPGTFLGTPDFVSPQQAEDPRKADARSDIFSLGATLYFLLTGDVPFPAATIAEKLSRGVHGPRPSPAAKRPDVPPALDEVVRKMLAADPGGRPPSAAAVVAALDNVLRATGQPRPALAPAVPRPPRNQPMPLNFFDQQKAALARLAGAVQGRVEAETELATTFQTTADKAERDVGRARKANAAAREKELADLDAAYAKTTGEIGGRFDKEQYEANRTRDTQRGTLTDRYKAAEEKAKAEYADKLWRLDSQLEAGQKQAKAQLEALQRKAAAGDEQVALLWAEAEPALARGRVTRAEVEPTGEAAPEDDDDPINRMQKAIDAARAALRKVDRAILPKVNLLVCVIIAAGATAAAAFPNADAKTAGIATAAAGVGGGCALWLLVRWLARKGTRKSGAALGQKLAAAHRGCDLLRTFAAAEFETEQKRLGEKHTRKKRDAANYYEPLLAQQKTQYDAEIERLVHDHRATTDSIKGRRKAETKAADDEYMANRNEAIGRLDAELNAADSVFDARMGAARVAQSAAWERMADEWQQATGEVAAALETLRAEDDRLFPYWDALTRPDRQLPSDVPPGVRLGDAALDLRALPQGVPADERLAPPATLSGVMPAFLPFPDGCSVVLKARDEGRTQSVSALQAMMLRFLTGLPPGKVRFTIIDPIGLGENFAAFMHLADYDEKLVNSQIWTEPQHIEKRLADLTDHIASVIQKYLRNQYKTIEEYNRAAGEVAEPYRVLVIANFPAGFTPDAAKRLVSIVNSGPSCGVCTLVSVDTRAAMPRDFLLADLEQPSFVMQCKDGKFVPKDETLAPFALTVDTPPDTSTVAQLVQRVGKASKDAVRVEVPFEYIAPKPGEVWKASAAKGFDVAVGRAGATRKQVFSLGRGTAQHALIAGKTGSGKSTLLHALITNLALTYSPEEAELYLIDFKEGVEFRPYADDRLPHARVVAIESEREFGLSVLQRLVGILQERGEKFRDAGVNDLASYRAERPTEITPRILLIVDEFQQFFVEDDKLAQEASLLLDRLVRQGRAFGIHVLLGSQTLGGAYSLARSTIDQMAVRVALQCSDADAQLILSKDNNAARLLSRPGEAIYNDQNGLVEGNDPFQVVWLDDAKREHLLHELRERAGDKYPPPLVFEGNASADIATNRALAAKMATRGETKVPLAWLGDPVAIKDPTAVAFRNVSASNLLVIGQNEEAARGLFAASLFGLAAQLATTEHTEGEPPALASATFTLLDGTPDDSDEAEYLRRLAAKLPHRTNAPDRSGLPAALAELTAEIERRQKGETADKAARFLFVFGVHRFRELRKNEDDFGFGRKSAERAVPPAEMFNTILREGPAVGIHLIAWCDSLTNLNRTFDRAAVRDFGMRVLFQMSPTDSSTLMDTPAASRLGRNRALLLVEDQERPEKFRPYRVPSPEWVTKAEEALR